MQGMGKWYSLRGLWLWPIAYPHEWAHGYSPWPPFFIKAYVISRITAIWSLSIGEGTPFCPLQKWRGSDTLIGDAWSKVASQFESIAMLPFAYKRVVTRGIATAAHVKVKGKGRWLCNLAHYAWWCTPLCTLMLSLWDGGWLSLEEDWW
jgi:hypothetical protein